MSPPMGEGTRRTPEGSRGNGDGCSPARGHIFVVIECTYLHVLESRYCGCAHACHMTKSNTKRVVVVSVFAF